MFCFHFDSSRIRRFPVRLLPPTTHSCLSDEAVGVVLELLLLELELEQLLSLLEMELELSLLEVELELLLLEVELEL